MRRPLVSPNTGKSEETPEISAHFFPSCAGVHRAPVAGTRQISRQNLDLERNDGPPHLAAAPIFRRGVDTAAGVVVLKLTEGE